MQLREWQQQFQESILKPEKHDEILFDWLLPGSSGKEQQLEVYRNAYAARLVEALQSNYPAVHQLLGDRDFAAMGNAYLEQHPPTHTSIRWFGGSLARFFTRQSPYADLPVLAELADFEWALCHTIDAADADVISVQSLQAIAPGKWGDLQFVLHPSASILELQWNTPQIWQALTAGETPPAPAGKTMNWLIHRQPDLVSTWRSVSDPELAALNCMIAGGSFADICEWVARSIADADNGALRAAELLRLWVGQGLIYMRPTGPNSH